MRLWVRSLALLRGSRIQRCRELWCRLQMQLRSRVAVALGVGQWLWLRLDPLDWESPYAVGAALGKAKRLKKKTHISEIGNWRSFCQRHCWFFFSQKKYIVCLIIYRAEKRRKQSLYGFYSFMVYSCVALTFTRPTLIAQNAATACEKNSFAGVSPPWLYSPGRYQNMSCICPIIGICSSLLLFIEVSEIQEATMLIQMVRSRGFRKYNSTNHN